MIAISIIWFIIFIITIILVLMEVINGSIEWRFWLCVFLMFLIIAIPAFTIPNYIASVDFYNEYSNFQETINSQELTFGQEYAIYGTVLKYNYQLYTYQSKFKRWRIFAPYDYRIGELLPMDLTYLDMNKYRFWE